MNEKTKKFNTRAFVAITAAIAGTGLPLSGYFNHLLQFDPMTVQRHAWMSTHNTLGVIFAVFAVWHVLLNRQALHNHVRGLSSRIPFIRREAIFAAALVAACLFAIVGHAFHVR